MNEFLQHWLLLVAVFSMAVMSPGPDFVMAVRNSVLHSRQAGIFTAIGFGAGVVFHVTYCLAGLALIISQSIVLFTIIKFIGAGYLFYVGYHAIQSKGFSPDDNVGLKPDSIKTMTRLMAFRSGFITNLFNPKATLFFLALFTQILSPSIALDQKIIFGLTCVFMTVVWFSIVAVVLTTPKIRAGFLRCSKWIDRVCGALFIGLGLKLVFTKLS